MHQLPQSPQLPLLTSPTQIKLEKPSTSTDKEDNIKEIMEDPRTLFNGGLSEEKNSSSPAATVAAFIADIKDKTSDVSRIIGEFRNLLGEENMAAKRRYKLRGLSKDQQALLPLRSAFQLPFKELMETWGVKNGRRVNQLINSLQHFIDHSILIESITYLVKQWSVEGSNHKTLAIHFLEQYVTFFYYNELQFSGLLTPLLDHCDQQDDSGIRKLSVSLLFNIRESIKPDIYATYFDKTINHYINNKEYTRAAEIYLFRINFLRKDPPRKGYIAPRIITPLRQELLETLIVNLSGIENGKIRNMPITLELLLTTKIYIQDGSIFDEKTKSFIRSTVINLINHNMTINELGKMNSLKYAFLLLSYFNDIFLEKTTDGIAINSDAYPFLPARVKTLFNYCKKTDQNGELEDAHCLSRILTKFPNEIPEDDIVEFLEVSCRGMVENDKLKKGYAVLLKLLLDKANSESLLKSDLLKNVFDSLMDYCLSTTKSGTIRDNNLIFILLNGFSNLVDENTFKNKITAFIAICSKMNEKGELVDPVSAGLLVNLIWLDDKNNKFKAYKNDVKELALSIPKGQSYCKLSAV